MALSPGTLVSTDQGLQPIEVLANSDVFLLRAGDNSFTRAVAYALKVSPQSRVTLQNGLSLMCSPDQQLAVVPRESALGNPVWRTQQQVHAGDCLLVRYQREDVALDENLFFVGKRYRDWVPTRALIEDCDIWNLFGFALADGYFPDPGLSQEAFRVFAYNRLNTELLDTFEAACDRHEIPVIRSEGEHPMLSVYFPDFLRWLRDLGFRAPDETPVIPPRFFQAPAWIREALLTGLFTCRAKWGSTSYRTPLIRFHEEAMRKSVLHCLWSVGVAAAEKADNYEYLIRVQDYNAYRERIGCLRKGVLADPVPPRGRHWDVLPAAPSQAVIRKIMTSQGFREIPSIERDQIIRLEQQSSPIRRAMAIEFLRKVGEPVPAALHYHYARVSSVDAEPVGKGTVYHVECTEKAFPKMRTDFPPTAVFFANHFTVGDVVFMPGPVAL